MPALSDEDQGTLLKLARSAIESELGQRRAPDRPESPPKPLSRPQGCFVTIHKNGMLRGCIGTIEPVTPLIDAVEQNAKNAAFQDPRFPPLTAEELADIDIEISRLTVPERLEFDDSEELLSLLEPGVHGVILTRGWRRATFLPQVWDQLPGKVVFLEHLCRKAGMDGNCWKSADVEVQVYRVEHFGEKK